MAETGLMLHLDTPGFSPHVGTRGDPVIVRGVQVSSGPASIGENLAREGPGRYQ